MSEINKSPWPGPKGLIPVTSGKAEDANVYNRNFLDSIHMEMRVIDSVEADLTTEIFGEKYSSPIMMPAFSHLNKVGKDDKKPMIEYAKAAKELVAPLLKNGKDGVVEKVNKMNEELSELMMYTGIKDTKSFDPSVLYIE